MSAPDWVDDLEVELLGYPPIGERWATPGVLARELDPTTRQTPALDVIDDALVALANCATMRLMLCMPPQEGKTRRVMWFVLWLLSQNPDLRVAVVTHDADLARSMGRALRDQVKDHPELGISLRADSKAAGRWNIAGRIGGVYCTTIRGSLTGRPADILVIDDPHKDLDDAISTHSRERVWRFWQGTAVPRLGDPKARVVLVQTRWHEDDLAGRLLAHNPGAWHLLSIPAVAESSDDPLGRTVGEAMVSTRGERDWDAARKDAGEYVWAAEYQQRPAPAEGGLFKRDDWRHWTLAEEGGVEMVAVDGHAWQLADCDRFITADLAISQRTSADFTVFAAWCITPNGDLILLDRFRGRIPEADHFEHVRALVERWQIPIVHVEASQHSTTIAYEAGRAGIPVAKLEADRDKFARALPAAKRVEQHRVFLPKAHWVGEWVDEHAGFPNAAHDDQVDVFAYAARVAAAHWLPPQSPQRVSRGEQVDFMTVAY